MNNSDSRSFLKSSSMSNLHRAKGIFCSAFPSMQGQVGKEDRVLALESEGQNVILAPAPDGCIIMSKLPKLFEPLSLLL